jgi:hypothetical protein
MSEFKTGVNFAILSKAFLWDFLYHTVLNLIIMMAAVVELPSDVLQ